MTFVRESLLNKRFAKILAASAALALTLGLCACGQNDQPAAEGDGTMQTEQLEAGVAATVDGESIAEDDITNYIMGMREQMGAADDAAWAEYLLQSALTPSTLREQIIGSQTETILIEKGAQEMGIEATPEEIDQSLAEMKTLYGDDAAWAAMLESMGTTEEQYREQIEAQILYSKLQEQVGGELADDDPMVLDYTKLYATAGDGSKKSSHIVFPEADRSIAEQVLAQINDGSISFADAAKQYSTDTASAENGGDLGWENLNAFSQEYTTALDALAVGQVSDLVSTPAGLEIIQCTDEFHAPAEVTSIDQVPSDWVQTIKDTASWQTQSESLQTWLQEQKEGADIKISPMPEGLPYDIDLSQYENAADDAAAADASATNGAADTTQGTDLETQQ